MNKQNAPLPSPSQQKTSKKKNENRASHTHTHNLRKCTHALTHTHTHTHIHVEKISAHLWEGIAVHDDMTCMLQLLPAPRACPLPQSPALCFLVLTYPALWSPTAPGLCTLAGIYDNNDDDYNYYYCGDAIVVRMLIVMMTVINIVRMLLV